MRGFRAADHRVTHLRAFKNSFEMRSTISGPWAVDHNKLGDSHKTVNK